MGYFSGVTKFTVREILQPRSTHQILSSRRLTSGTITTDIFDTRRFKAAVVYGNISQLSGGAGTTLNYEMQGSVYGNADESWWGISGAARTTTGLYWDRLPGGLSFESSGSLNNFTRFKIFNNASTSGGIWAQLDCNFVKL